MRYRSRTELASNILEAANGGATKTKIMYKAFLSYAQLKEYRTTSKGIKFLETSRLLGGLLEVSASNKNRLAKHV
jgi:predicted transcriptional regulator